MIQGAGISTGYPNPDGKYPDISRDFSGQGLANLAVSLFQGLPVGGSLSSTALVVSAGAKSRLANVFLGVFAIIAVLLFAPLIELFPMAGLAGILVIAGVQSIKLPRIRTVWRTRSASGILMLFTFIATLALPIQSAVFLSVLLSFVMHIFRSAERVEIIEIVPLGRGRYEQRPAPEKLPSNKVIMIAPVGSLFFAGAIEFEEDLPKIEGANKSVVLLRLRGTEDVGSTFLKVISRYASNISENDGKFILSGVNEHVFHQLEKTGLIDELGAENIYSATSIIGDSTLAAYYDGEQWLAEKNELIQSNEGKEEQSGE